MSSAWLPSAWLPSCIVWSTWASKRNGIEQIALHCQLENRIMKSIPSRGTGVMTRVTMPFTLLLTVVTPAQSIDIGVAITHNHAGPDSVSLLCFLEARCKMCFCCH